MHYFASVVNCVRLVQELYNLKERPLPIISINHG